MKITLVLIISTLFSLTSFGQSPLSDSEIDNLVKIAELYSKNTSYHEQDFETKIKPLETENLKGVISTLGRNSSGKKALSSENLSRPNDSELLYWYVIREIHYNKTSKDSIKPTNREIAVKTLNANIDMRWMVDNYYYRISASIASLFNDANLKKTNLEMNSYGLKTETEKAALYFMVVNACTQRFKVLSMMRNNAKVLEFAAKLPKMNGKPYFYYTDFNYEDFDWIGHEKVESYNDRHLGNLYSTLLVHFTALASADKIDEAKELYSNSILSIPKYFKYSGMESDLNELYKKSR